MKYLCLAYYDPVKFAAMSDADRDALVRQCPAHDRALRETGRLVLQASLGDGRASIALRPGKDGRPSITDGPFAETKEQVGGFFIIEAEDLDEAIRTAAKHPAALLGAAVGWGIEVRPIEGYMDNPSEQEIPPCRP